MCFLDVKHIGFTAVEASQILQLTPSHREQRFLQNVSCPDPNLVSEYMFLEERMGACYRLAMLSKYHGSALDMGQRHFGDPEMVHLGCGLA